MKRKVLTGDRRSQGHTGATACQLSRPWSPEEVAHLACVLSEDVTFPGPTVLTRLRIWMETQRFGSALPVAVPPPMLRVSSG